MDRELIKFDLTQAAPSEKKLVTDLAELAPYARNCGLTMTAEIAGEIAAARREALKSSGRTELRGDAVVRLVRAFMESDYITQEDFSYTIGELIDLFYYIKNETGGALSDDDLISEMFTVFNGMCGGSIEDMQARGLEKILRRTNWGDSDIWGEYEEIEKEERYEDWRE